MKRGYLAVLFLGCLLLSAPAFAQAPAYLLQWGSYGTGNGQFDAPLGIAVAPDGRVYVADAYNQRVQVFTSAGVYLAQWATTFVPADVAVGADGYVYVLNYSSGSDDLIEKCTADGSRVTEWWLEGSDCLGLGVDAQGNVYVADLPNCRVLKYTSDGALVTQWGTQGTGDGQFQYPADVAVDPSGNVYVADGNNQRIQKFTGDGTYLAQWATSAGAPLSLTTNAAGDVYATVRYSVQMYRGDGTLVTQWGTEGTGDGQFTGPWGLAVNAQGGVYVTDSNGNRVEVFGDATVAAERTTWGRLKSIYR